MKYEQIDPYTCFIYLKAPANQIVYLQALFEIYESLGIVRTIDAKNHLLCLITSKDLLASAIAALEACKAQVNFEIIDRPSHVDPENFV